MGPAISGALVGVVSSGTLPEPTAPGLLADTIQSIVLDGNALSDVLQSKAGSSLEGVGTESVNRKIKNENSVN